MKLILKDVRATFVNVFNVDDNGKYALTVLIAPDSAQYKQVLKVMNDVAVEAWKEKGVGYLKNLLATDSSCLRDGNLKELDKYPAYENMFYLAARNSVKPGAFSNIQDAATGRPLVTTQSDGLIYPGCMVNISVDIYAQTPKTIVNKTTGQTEQLPRRINASLSGVQFAAHNDAFGSSGVSTGSEFESIPAEVETDYNFL